MFAVWEGEDLCFGGLAIGFPVVAVGGEERGGDWGGRGWRGDGVGDRYRYGDVCFRRWGRFGWHLFLRRYR